MRMCRSASMPPPLLPRGFTLIELLVALAVMALLALLSWRGLDAMVSAQTQTRQRAEAHWVLQTALAQWSSDLEALMPLAHTKTLDWDGQVLRLTRRASLWPDPGALVVAWTRRSSQSTPSLSGSGSAHPQWLRWQSAPLHTVAEWQQAWSQAEQWARNPSDSLQRNEVALLPLAEWRLFYYREGAWSHPLSSTNTQQANNANASADSSNPYAPTRNGFNSATYTARLPEGIRLELVLPSGQGSAVAGLLVRDWFNPITTGL